MTASETHRLGTPILKSQIPPPAFGTLLRGILLVTISVSVFMYLADTPLTALSLTVCTGVVFWAFVSASREMKVKKAISLAAELPRDLGSLMAKESLRARMAACNDALKLLATIERLDETTNAIPNKGEIRRQLSELRRALPILHLIEKRNTCLARGHTRKELRLLKDILSHIQTLGLTEEEIERLNTKDRLTNSSLSLSGIRQRVRDLERITGSITAVTPATILQE